MRTKLKGMKRVAEAVRGCFVHGGTLRYGDQSVGNVPSPVAPFQSILCKPYTIAVAMAVTEAEHAGRLGVFDIAAGVTVTLPRATGSGAIFRFFVKTTVTSVNDIIQVANTDDVMQGLLVMAQDGGDTAVAFETASTSDTITMNGSTKGGIRGDYIEIQDVAPGLFRVNGQLSGTGTEATPFSAAV